MDGWTDTSGWISSFLQTYPEPRPELCPDVSCSERALIQGKETCLFWGGEGVTQFLVLPGAHVHLYYI